MKLTKIDDLTLGQHHYIGAEDKCYFLGEYTPGAGYETPTNDLIHNFKIPPSQTHRLHYKRRAIATIGAQLRSTVLPGLGPLVVVPVPPSKIVGHPDYDDRLVEALLSGGIPPTAIRRLVVQKVSTLADHETRARQSIDDLRENLSIDESQLNPRPAGVVVFDDVLTSGKHFRAIKDLLVATYGSAFRVAGLFVARRVVTAAKDFEDLK